MLSTGPSSRGGRASASQPCAVHSRGSRRLCVCRPIVMMRTRFFVSYALRTLAVRISYAVCTHVVRNFPHGPCPSALNGDVRQLCVRKRTKCVRQNVRQNHAYDKIAKRTTILVRMSYADTRSAYDHRTDRAKNVVRVYNCRTSVRSVMCFVRLSYACRTTPTIPYDMRTDSVRNTYSRRTKCVRQEKSSSHQLINRASANFPVSLGKKLNKYKS